jgi:hypothetical protein
MNPLAANAESTANGNVGTNTMSGPGGGGGGSAMSFDPPPPVGGCAMSPEPGLVAGLEQAANMPTPRSTP